MSLVQAFGHTTWLIPDGYLPVGEADGLDSHEAICVLNTGDHDARLAVTVFLEDAPPLGPFRVVVPAQRTRHVRTDGLRTDEGAAIPVDVPYAIVVESDVAVSVQHSRMDLRSSAMALMTTVAIPVS